MYRDQCSADVHTRVADATHLDGCEGRRDTTSWPAIVVAQQVLGGVRLQTVGHPNVTASVHELQHMPACMLYPEFSSPLAQLPTSRQAAPAP